MRQPACIENNPIMQIAFRDFVLWAAGEPQMLAAFKKYSGIDLSAPRAPIDQLIDEAAGEPQWAAFVEWLIEFHWGEEPTGAPGVFPQQGGEGGGG